MQQLIDIEFASHTVLAVVHRLRLIRHYDRVAVLKNGVLVEFDNPEALLSRESQFAQLYRSGNYD